MSTPIKRTDETTTKVVYLTEVAETLTQDALAWARAKLSLHERDLPLEKQFERAAFCDYLKYKLATGVASVLAAKDLRIQTVYSYDPSDNPDGVEGIEVPQDATIHLCVKVTAPSAALETFVSSLDRALTASLRELPSAVFAQRQSILDVVLVSEEDVMLCRGYAALISSVFAPPLKIWEREA